MPELTEDELKSLIDEATIDACDVVEQLAGFTVMLYDGLEVPFKTTVLGVPVEVEDVTQTEDHRIVAECVRDGHRQPIAIEDLPLPDPAPKGAEWIAAYRLWSHRLWSSRR